MAEIDIHVIVIQKSNMYITEFSIGMLNSGIRNLLKISLSQIKPFITASFNF